jgi:hypothetical protein
MSKNFKYGVEVHIKVGGKEGYESFAPVEATLKIGELDALPKCREEVRALAREAVRQCEAVIDKLIAHHATVESPAETADL